VLMVNDRDQHDASAHSISNPETQKFKRGSKNQGILFQGKHLCPWNILSVWNRVLLRIMESVHCSLLSLDGRIREMPQIS